MLRFTETKKWENSWFRNLSNEGKLVYLYLTDVCDHAGVWKCDYDLASFMTKVDEKRLVEAINELGDRVVKISESRLLLPRFVKFQVKGDLKDTHNPHKAIIKCLEKHGLTYDKVGGIVALDGTSSEPEVKDADIEPDILPFEIESEEDSVVEKFHETLPTLARIRLVTDSRKKKIINLGKHLTKLESTWDEYFLRVANSEFLTGKAENADWKATFDWLLKPSNAEKVLEGNYDGRPKRTNRQDHAGGF